MVDNIEYLKATLKDEGAAVKLHALLFEDDETKTAQEIAKQVHSALKNKLLWVAKSGDKIVGYILCELFDKKHHHFPNSVFIDGLYVSEEYRKKGLGKNLVEQVLKSDFPKQYTYFSVTHDPASLKLTVFYNSFGFVKKGTTNAGNIMMTKKR